MYGLTAILAAICVDAAAEISKSKENVWENQNNRSLTAVYCH